MILCLQYFKGHTPLTTTCRIYVSHPPSTSKFAPNTEFVIMHLCACADTSKSLSWHEHAAAALGMSVMWVLFHVLFLSVVGHKVGNKIMYAASKHALTVVNEGVRRELREMKSNVKITVSNISLFLPSSLP